jgi:dipeptidase
MQYLQESTYWAFSVVGNWMAKARLFIHPDIVSTQQSLEAPLFAEQSSVESSAAALIERGDVPSAVALLTRTSSEAAVKALATYQSLFELFVSKFHDGYVMETPDAEIIKVSVYCMHIYI